MAHAAAGDDETGIDDGADEGHAFVDRLLVLFAGMEGELELLAQVFFDDADIAKHLGALFHGNNDEKVVDVATVMFVAEIELDEAVELVEEDIGEELAGEIANDDATVFGLIEETFVSRELVPIAAMTMDTDAFHGLVVNNFVPNVFEKSIEFMFVGRMAADVVFGIREFAMEKLSFETPEDASIEEVVVEAHEIALNVELDGESLASVVFGDLADMMGKTFLSIEGAFADATGVGIGAEATVPPLGADIKKKVVNDAVAERGGDDFTDDGVMDDKGDAATGFVVMADETVAEINNVFHGVEFELMLIDGLAFAFASDVVGNPKFMKKEFFKTIVIHRSFLGCSSLLYSRAVIRSMRTRCSRMSQRSR